MRALLVLAFVSLPALAATDAEAQTAYEAKQYEVCARLYAEIAEKTVGDGKATHLYNAACCSALGGRVDAALAAVEQGLALNPEAAGEMLKDTDLASLKGQARFVAATKKAEGVMAAQRKTQNVALADELMKMVELDQAGRNDAIAKGAGAASKEWATINALDEKHTTRLKAIVAKHGWPGRKLVGKRAANGAWLLVQHATHDKPFMEKALALMKAAGPDVDQVDVAYLEDRVNIMLGREQRYGTQFEQKDGKWQPQPLEDAEHVDERRRALGLSTMAEQLEVIKGRYAPAPDAGR